MPIGTVHVVEKIGLSGCCESIDLQLSDPLALPTGLPVLVKMEATTCSLRTARH